MRLLAVVFHLVAGLALTACPPPVNAPGDAGPVPVADAGVDPGGYCESIVDFFCAFYLRCGRMAVADVDACEPVFLEACNARFEPSFASLARGGLVELSTAGVDACRAHLESVPCAEQLLDLDGPCAGMWEGKQVAGEACAFDIETFACAPGTLCTIDLTLCGTCERVIDDGANCDVDGVTCARESFCGGDGSCVARKRVGEACSAQDRCVLGAVCDNLVCTAPGYVGVGDPCDAFASRCPYASSCVGGVCVAAVGLDDACSATSPCDSGGFCDPGAPAPGDEICVALVEQGGVCDESAQCQTGVCVTDVGACSALPSACFP